MDIDNSEIIVPLACLTVARELKLVISKLRDGFIKRQAPAGLPHADIHQALGGCWDRLSNCPGALSVAVNNLGNILSRENAADSSVSRAVGEVDKEVDRLVSAYHDLWRRPFPSGLEKGQILTAAVFERLMRTLLDSFEQLVMAIDEPGEAIARYGTTTINLAIVLQVDEEIAEFNSWLDSLRGKQSCPSVPSAGLGTFAASFFLGWWVGKE